MQRPDVRESGATRQAGGATPGGLYGPYLAEALGKMLGAPEEGALAFVRCLDRSAVIELCADPGFQVAGWQIRGVTNRHEPGSRLITGGQAVELREDKAGRMLLLVDVATAGAGMDGIYTAAREVTEKELFAAAVGLAGHRIRRGYKGPADSAVRRARRLGQGRSVSPWREFDFYVRVAADPGSLGPALSQLGLWPVKLAETPRRDQWAKDLETSALMVEKLLIGPAALRPPADRVASLMLREPPPGVPQMLQKLLHDSAGRPLEDALRQLLADVNVPLWLNAGLRPQFSGDELQGLEPVPWRAKPTKGAGRGKLYAWSGLTDVRDDDEALPELVVDLNATTAKEMAKLEVRWKTRPPALPKAAAEYRLEVISQDEVLVAETVGHSEKEVQKFKFTAEHFAALEGSRKFTAAVRVSAPGRPQVAPLTTEDFTLRFGQVDGVEGEGGGAGTKVPRLVEAVVRLAEKDEKKFIDLSGRRGPTHFKEDGKGWVTFRAESHGRFSRAFRVFRPPLLKLVETDWSQQGGSVGRWVVKVRSDGSRVGEPAFIPAEAGDVPADAWAALQAASAALCAESAKHCGMVGRVGCGDTAAGDAYLAAWEAALGRGGPELALANTVEVRSLSGRTIGLIVLPSHPLRVAWHTAYDRLAQHAACKTKLSAAEVIAALAGLDSSQFPAVLPGTAEGRSFVFGDVLSPHAVAMVPDEEPEPKAAVALMANCLSDEPGGPPPGEVGPAVGRRTAEALGREIDRYARCHAVHRLLHVHALRPGDGATVARALGRALQAGAPEPAQNAGADDEGAPAEGRRPLAFVLELFPAARGDLARFAGVTGRFLAQAAERRRSGAGGLAAEDRWMLESLPCEGGVNLPRLRWARREVALPESAAHVAVAFDTFDSSVAAEPADRLGGPRPMHAFGLVAHAQRRFRPGPEPRWESFIPPAACGEPHPAGAELSDRLLRLHAALLRLAGRNARGGEADGGAAAAPGAALWPVLRTTLSADDRAALAQLHRLSDWVVSIDRNAGIEYFDSPRDAGDVYDAYVIDAVPERADLGALQLITSTSQLEELRALLDEAVGEMGLSGSGRNCEFLLRHLKALSGRLAVRLASPDVHRGELVALAMLHAGCLAAGGGADPAWLPAARGFFVPLDDVPDLRPPAPRGKRAAAATPAEPGEEDAPADPDGDTRADLLFISAEGDGGGLALRFVEVKFRRHLRTARDRGLIEAVVEQADGTAARWREWYFGPKLSDVQRALRRSHLARALRFYCDKARRHHLSEDAWGRLADAIDRMMTQGAAYGPAEVGESNRGYVFCPEASGGEPSELPADSEQGTRVFLFGPGLLPDPAGGRVSEEVGTPFKSDLEVGHAGPSGPGFPAPTGVMKPPGEGAVDPIPVHLGRGIPGGEPVVWDLSIRSNPHLMIVGLPGMGKTTCLINLCRQLIAGNVTPIVFSYHEDLDEKLGKDVPGLRLLDHSSLGFNPLTIERPDAHAHVTSAGDLRDIFAAIFPELGDVQTERVRQAIKQSYLEQGWGGPGATAGGPPAPKFRRFFELLRDAEKPDKAQQGLMARLAELDDYGVFAGEGAGRRLLDSAEPTVLQVHKSTNDKVQRAFASLIFYGLYKDMFRRGVQQRITHAFVFDEAHRAGRLKLLPTMAKECRKYGISLIVASQEARDFDPSLYAAVASYLALRLTEHDARALARHLAASDVERVTADRLKEMEKYQALFRGEGRRRPVRITLAG